MRRRLRRTNRHWRQRWRRRPSAGASLGWRRFARSSPSDMLCSRMRRRPNLPRLPLRGAVLFWRRGHQHIRIPPASLAHLGRILVGRSCDVRSDHGVAESNSSGCGLADMLMVSAFGDSGGAVRSPISLGSTWLPDANVNVELQARPRLRRERPSPFASGSVPPACV